MTHRQRLGVTYMWQRLIGLRSAPPTITAQGDLKAGDLALHQRSLRDALAWRLRRRP